MNIVSKFIELRELVACRLLSTKDIEELRSEIEQDIQDAKNGEFEDNELALREASEELVKVDKELARRKRR